MIYPNVIKNNIGDFTPVAPWVSVDFEFPPETMAPTIIGLSSGQRPHSSYYTSLGRHVLSALEAAQVVWVGHNTLTVEKRIIENETGSHIPLARCEDTLLRHYLCNSELCKGAPKDEDDTDPRGQGYMDLWSMSSLYTELPQWKECRHEKCSGPCRFHDVLGYNGTDAYACDVALPRLRAEMVRKHIPENLYENLKKVVMCCDAMERQGIKTDRAYINKIEREFEINKAKLFPFEIKRKIGKKGQELKGEHIVWNAPFNPRSSKQVIAWFAKQNITLNTSDKKEIEKSLMRLSPSCVPSVRNWLERLHEYKDEGKGLTAWTSEKFYHADNLLHPRFIAYATSLGRLASSNPNFQNMPRVGWGKKVRAVVIPRDPSLILAKADKSQLELRVCLWYAGVEPPKGDAFSWLVEQGKGLFEKIAADNPSVGFSPRDWTKSISHGGNYLEGIKVLSSKDLDSARTKRMVSEGALLVYRDWEYHGGLVSFTGSNLAERLFGSATWENRKRALEIQGAYFERFSAIRQWHRRITNDIERGFVSSASGRYLTLRGTPEDKAKIAAAFFGQGGGADDVQEGMIKYWEMGKIPLIQVHDELVFEFPRETTDAVILDHFSVMSEESKYMPGFRCPVKVGRGENWLDMTAIGAV